MDIPILDLKAQLARYREAALAAMTRVMDSQALVLGAEVKAFEADLAAYMGLEHVIGVSSGTDALLVALMALDIGPGDEVLTTPFSFFATAGVVARLGARPRFVDIDPVTFNLDEKSARAAITPRTRAIIPVHLFGQMADLGALYGDPEAPPIVEDAAQALGATLRGRMTGQYGVCTCISFYPTKNLGAFGDAGAVATTDAMFAEKLRMLRVHGARPKYFHHVVGGNFRLDAIQAAVLAVKLPLLEAWTEGRRQNAARYDALFADSGLVERGLVTPPRAAVDGRHVFNQYVIRAQRRDGLRAHLAARGIGTMVYYPGPLHLQPCFAELGHGPGDFPVAEQACAEVLALPVQPELGPDALARVVDEVRAFYGAPTGA